MTKRKGRGPSMRDLSTDDAIVSVLAANGGDMHRRDLVRKLGHRADFAQALNRQRRLKNIELVSVTRHGRQQLALVRLIGVMAVHAGAGYVRLNRGDTT